MNLELTNPATLKKELRKHDLVHFMVTLGYGVHIENRKLYELYLALTTFKIVMASHNSYVRRNQEIFFDDNAPDESNPYFPLNNPKIVSILAGGRTAQKTMPGVSEAMAMYRYIADQKCGLEEPVTTILEEESITTNQNLKNVKRLIDFLAPVNYRLTIYCDSIRRLKVSIMSRLIFPRTLREIVGFPATEDSALKQYLVATPLDIASLFFPFLERHELAYRQKIIARS